MNPQLEAWTGKFGNEYTIRNTGDERIITERREVFNEISQHTAILMNILEVGCNRGLNLLAIDPWNKGRVTGVEPNERARRAAEMHGFRVYPDSGDNLQFLDGSFELCFTVGVLIHCPDFMSVVKEMSRVSRRYLLFMEYFSEEDTEIEYRGERGLLWKRNWPRHFKTMLGEPIASGFAGKDRGFDDVTWWLYQK